MADILVICLDRVIYSIKTFKGYVPWNVLNEIFTVSIYFATENDVMKPVNGSRDVNERHVMWPNW